MAKPSLKCPICRQPTASASKHAPFCSARCRDVDLGSWLGEGYRISRPIMPFELQKTLAETVPPDDDN